MAKRATDVDDYVGRRIRQRRLELGLSQSELADAIGVSFQQVQKYENGSNRVSAGRLYAIARHLGATLDYFFDGADLPAANQPNSKLLFKHDKQVISLVRSFIQISDDGTRSAAVGLVSAIANAEAAKGHS